MRVAICDDDSAVHTNFISCIQSNPLCADDLTIDVYSDGKEFLAANQTYDILFIEILMQKSNGMETVSALREEQVRFVVFLSSRREFAVRLSGSMRSTLSSNPLRRRKSALHYSVVWKNSFPTATSRN